MSWFIKKFDYNYQDEPWYDSKDAVERSLKLLDDYGSRISLRNDK